jgi:carbon-monoxide dehydrogenase small subunit
MAEDVALTVNGEATTLSVEADTSLLRALRDHGHTEVTGACEQGECGSCTVRLDDRTVCSCLVPAAICASASVTTVRGLLSADLADALSEYGAVQCGFCTPGFVVSATTALERSPQPLTRNDVRELLAGNLCRCTGYEALIDAIIHVDRARRGSQ